MSAFFLYFNDGNPDLAIKPELIGPQLVHFPWVQWKSFKSKNLQIIYTENKSDTLNIFPDKYNKLLFIIHGYILESGGGITRIDKGESEYSIQNQMRKRYEQGGINACIGLNGQYNLLVWDTEKLTFEVANDRLGISQIFFARIDEHRFVITTDIVTLKSVPKHTPKISRRGIFDLLYLGIAFEERTVLEGVTRLLPNASFKITKDGLKLIEEKQLPFSDKNWGTTLPPLLDDLDERYLQSVKRVFTNKDKILFLLSGGKDSRLYGNFLKKAGITPQCITAGETHHNEVYLAREVSRVLNFPWESVGLKIEEDYQYFTETLKIDSFSRHVLPFIRLNILKDYAQDYEYLTGAFLGDAIIGSDYIAIQIKLGKDAEEGATNYLNFKRRPSFYSDDKIRQLFNIDSDDFIYEYKNDIVNLLPRLAKEPYHQIMSLDLRANCRYKVGAALRILTTMLPLRLPCIDNDLMDFSLSLPPALLCDRLLMNYYLIQKNPELATIPMDLRYDRAVGLIRGIKQDLKYKFWYNFIEKIKFPLLHHSGYPFILTMQYFEHITSLQDQVFKNMLQNSLGSVEQLEGILNVDLARKLLSNPISQEPRPGFGIRSLVTVTNIAQTFNT